MRYEPHDYQKRAINMILSKPAVGLFLEMGLGKTVITLTATNQLLYEQFAVTRVLVIAPLKVAEDTWSRESAKWDHLHDLKIAKILGTVTQRAEAAASDADIYVINRENVVWLVERYPKAKWRWDMVVIDELSSFKSNRAERFKALRRVRPYIRRIVGLTGTPNPNGYMDLWAEIFLLDQGERLERTIGRYRELYFKPGRGDGHITYEWRLREGADKAIQARIADITVSMKAEDYLKLPERIDNVVRVRLGDEAFKTYREMERNQIIELNNETVTAVSAASVMGKLLQMSGGAVYDDNGGYVEFHTEKTKALQEIIDTNDTPVLVFYAYRHEKERLLKALAKLKPRMLDTEQDISEWNDGKIRLLLAHPASVGYGLNLQAGGHTIVWYSLPWSLELYQQANERLNRPGQQHVCRVYHLILQGTHDSRVLKALKNKEKGQDAAIEALRLEILKEVKAE